MRIIITSFYFLLFTYGSTIWRVDYSSTTMVEICDNGIDDDMDGTIDINDDDCRCNPIVPSGLIPNPSFEDRSCCPQEKARLDCANSWIQASAATTDYINTCGFLGNVIDAPLPIADGDGAIGLRDGSTNNGNYKEYAGACLTEPIEAGKSYKLQLSVGFTNPNTSPDLTLTIFGHPSCTALPFGNNNAGIGCPLNVSGWIEIGKTTVGGQDEWIETTIDFITSQNINAVAIGPDCARRDESSDRYYFFDNLRLAETIDFGYQITVTGGNPCQTDFMLSLTGSAPAETYQWYRNGIAISSATNTIYDVPDDINREGLYQVRIENAIGCQLTDPYNVIKDQNSFNENNFACANSTYWFGTESLTSSGLYTKTFSDSNGCDSTVILQLTFREQNQNSIDTTICRGQYVKLGNKVLTVAGEYVLRLNDRFGCDSTVAVNLNIKEPSAAIDLVDQTLELGESFILDLSGQDANVQSFIWSSDLFEICSDCQSQILSPIQNTSYYLNAIDLNNCVIQDTFRVTVNKNYKIFVPNVFSPNGDGRNDFFTFYLSKASSIVKSFQIIDRWGNLIFEANNTLTLEWDGTFNGQQLNMDTFVYAAEVVFIDGHVETITGTVQIIR